MNIVELAISFLDASHAGRIIDAGTTAVGGHRTIVGRKEMEMRDWKREQVFNNSGFRNGGQLIHRKK